MTKHPFKVVETTTNLRLLRNNKEFLWSVPKANGPSENDRRIMDKIKEIFEKANG